MSDSDSPRRKKDSPAPEEHRGLPHSAELERTVLGSLLDARQAAAVHIVREKVRHPIVFFERDHRLIYQACMDLDDEGQRLDLPTVVERLRRTRFQIAVDRLRRLQALMDAEELDGMKRATLRNLYRFRPEDEANDGAENVLEAVGGHSALVALIKWASGSNLGQHAGLLWDTYCKRRLIVQVRRIGDESQDSTENFTALMDKASASMMRLSRLDASSSVHALPEVVEEALAVIGKRQTEPDTSVTTGYPELDERLNRLRGGGLYILAARPGVGKTSFVLSVVLNILQQAPNNHILFFSLEVGRVDLVTKLLSGVSQVDSRKIENGTFSVEEQDLITAAGENLKELPLHVMDVADLTVQGLRSTVKRYMAQCNNSLRLVVLDYLQLLTSHRPDMSEYERISDISRTLKVLALELNITILALSQMHRESERAAGKPREPRLSDLRGSGSLEQDADSVLFLHRMDEGTDDEGAAASGRDIKVVVAKNRFGPTGWMQMKFHPSTQRFVPCQKTVVPDEGGGGERPWKGKAKKQPKQQDDEESNRDPRELFDPHHAEGASNAF